MMEEQRVRPQFSPEVSVFLDEFVAAVKNAAGGSLQSIVLFGSGAEGRLRNTSDLNVMCLLTSVDLTTLDGMRPTLKEGHALCRLRVLFMTPQELHTNARLFPVKFADMKRRHFMLHGADILSEIEIDRAALLFRLRQNLTNLKLRMRAAYVWDGDNAPRLSLSLADSAGPLRACASAVYLLQGIDLAPREALEKAANVAGMKPAHLGNLSRVREGAALSLLQVTETHKAFQNLCEKLLEDLRESV